MHRFDKTTRKQFHELVTTAMDCLKLLTWEAEGPPSKPLDVSKIFESMVRAYTGAWHLWKKGMSQELLRVARPGRHFSVLGYEDATAHGAVLGATQNVLDWLSLPMDVRRHRRGLVGDLLLQDDALHEEIMTLNPDAILRAVEHFCQPAGKTREEQAAQNQAETALSRDLKVEGAHLIDLGVERLGEARVEGEPEWEEVHGLVVVRGMGVEKVIKAPALVRLFKAVATSEGRSVDWRDVIRSWMMEDGKATVTEPETLRRNAHRIKTELEELAHWWHYDTKGGTWGEPG